MEMVKTELKKKGLKMKVINEHVEAEATATKCEATSV